MDPRTGPGPVLRGLALASIFMIWAGAVLASNMGFKFNKRLQPNFSVRTAPKGDNWIALPYANPFPDAKTLCTRLSLANTANVFQLDPATGLPLVNFPCVLNTFVPLDATRGIRIHIPGPAPSNAILVGSHIDGVPLPPIIGGFTAVDAPKRDNWLSFPYHSTARNAEDICVQLGLGLTQGTVTRIDPVTGVVSIHPCGTIVTNFPFHPAEALLVRKMSPGDIVGFIPPHL